MKMNKKTLALAFAVIIIPGLIWYGFVFKTLWLWFMVPLGSPIITIGHAIGIDFLIMFASNSSIKQNENEKDTFKMIFLFIVKPAVVLLFSFIVKGFI